MGIDQTVLDVPMEKRRPCLDVVTALSVRTDLKPKKIERTVENVPMESLNQHWIAKTALIVETV
jgi:hypothetical protein